MMLHEEFTLKNLGVYIIGVIGLCDHKIWMFTNPKLSNSLKIPLA